MKAKGRAWSQSALRAWNGSYTICGMRADETSVHVGFASGAKGTALGAMRTVAEWTGVNAIHKYGVW